MTSFRGIYPTLLLSRPFAFSENNYGRHLAGLLGIFDAYLDQSGVELRPLVETAASRTHPRAFAGFESLLDATIVRAHIESRFATMERVCRGGMPRPSGSPDAIDASFSADTPAHSHSRGVTEIGRLPTSFNLSTLRADPGRANVERTQHLRDRPSDRCQSRGHQTRRGDVGVGLFPLPGLGLVKEPHGEARAPSETSCHRFRLATALCGVDANALRGQIVR